MSAVLKEAGWNSAADPVSVRFSHLDWLESEAIHIMREVVAETQESRRCSFPAARIRS